MHVLDREAAMIAYTNDTLRQHHLCGQVIVSERVMALPKETYHLIVELIRRFNDFNPRVDPKGWHDFGSVEVNGEYYYFLIEQIVTPQKRVLARVMRVIHSSEYMGIGISNESKAE